MLEKIDLEKIINDPSYGEEEETSTNSIKVKRDIMKSLTIQGYDELVDMYGDLTYYIEKHRDFLLSGCNGLTNAQQEIKKEYETLLQFNQKSFEHLEKLLTERQKLINKKGE